MIGRSSHHLAIALVVRSSKSGIIGPWQGTAVIRLTNPCRTASRITAHFLLRQLIAEGWGVCTVSSDGLQPAATITWQRPQSVKPTPCLKSRKRPREPIARRQASDARPIHGAGSIIALGKCSVTSIDAILCQRPLPQYQYTAFSCR